MLRQQLHHGRLFAATHGHRFGLYTSCATWVGHLEQWLGASNHA